MIGQNHLYMILSIANNNLLSTSKRQDKALDQLFEIQIDASNIYLVNVEVMSQ